MSTEEKRKKKPSATAKGLAGSLAGAIETLCVWPLESTKTKLQLQKKLSTPPPFTGFVGCVKHTVRESGVMGLYHGIIPVLAGSLPKAGLRFGVFAKLDEVFRRADGTTTPLRTLTAGTVAGSIEAMVVVTPVETVKTKLIQLKMKTGPGVLHIARTEGLQGFYSGALPTIMKQGSNQGLRFMFFAQYKALVLTFRGTNDLSNVEAVAGGMMAGMFSTLVNNPADVIKTRMQGVNGASFGFMQTLRGILTQEGILVLWSGLGPRLARVVPGQGIIFASSEFITRIMSESFGL